MLTSMEKLILGVFGAALIVTGVLATETRMLFFWPGCLLMGLAALFLTVRWRVRVIFPPDEACLATTLLFTLYIAARAIVSPVELWAREDFFIVCAALVTYLLAATLCSHPRTRLGLLFVLLALAAGNLAVGMIQFGGRWDFHVVPGFLRAFDESRIGGFFNNSNHLAAFLSMVLFLCTGWMLFGRLGTAGRLVLCFILLTMTTGTALTQSRGALLGAAVGAVVFTLAALWLLWQTHRHLFKWALIAGPILLLLAGGVLWKVNEETLARRLKEGPGVDDIRAHIWPAALAQHAQAPWTGAGSRMFQSGCAQFRDPRQSPNTGEALFAHNEFLQMLADYGWTGLLLLVLMLLAHARSAGRFLRWFVRRKFARTGHLAGTTLTMGALGGLAASLAHAVVEFHWHVPAVAVTGALLLGLLANPGIDMEDRAPSSPWLRWARPGIKFACAGAGFCLALGAVTWGAADYHVGRAAVLTKQKDNAGALEHLLRAGEVDTRNAEIFHLRGLAWLESWRPDQSPAERQRVLAAGVADLRRSCELNPWSHFYWLPLADALRAAGQPEEALKAIHRACELAPLHEEPRVALAIHLHSLRRYEEAEMACLWASRARALNPEGSANWSTEHQLLLQDTAFAAERERRRRQSVP